MLRPAVFALLALAATPARAEDPHQLASAMQGKTFVCHQAQDSDIVDSGRLKSETQIRFRFLDTNGAMEAISATFLTLNGTTYRSDLAFTGHGEVEGDAVVLVLETSRFTRRDPLPNDAQWTSSTGRLRLTGSIASPHLAGTLTDSAGNALDLACFKSD